MTYIGSNAFTSVAVKELRFEGPFTGMGGGAFSSCPNLETVYINNTSGNVLVCDQGFKGAKMLKEVTMNGISINHYTFENVNALTDGGLVVVATNVGDIGEMAFKNTTNLSSVTLSGVTSLGSSAFLNCTNLKTADISGPITTISGNTFSNCTKIESAIIRVIGNPFPDATSVGGITSIVSKDVYENNKDDYETGRHFVYGYNLCELLYNGIHTPDLEKSNACVTVCSVCNYTVIEHAEDAELSVKVEYADFMQKGVKTTSCTNDGCTYSTSENLNELFVCLGYSASENGDGGFALGFLIDKKAIGEYEKATNETLKYGVFAVSQQKLGSGSVFDTEDGSLVSGAISIDVTGYEYSAFVIKVVGFAEEQKDSKLAMGAYVAVTKDGTTTYEYLQDDSEGTKVNDYFFVSYNEIIDAPKTEA